MKLVTKNGLTFATGMFWQIPDEGKRSINFRKLSKDTGQNMFCYIKSINTWGFCQKKELNGERKIASFGQFIIESSKLSSQYANSIICFKFKSVGEVDEGQVLEHDLYGYIVLVNGTICPEDGEYVARIEMVLQSVYEKASKHEIETLYLPFEVSEQFFSIFEILDDAYNNEELLKYAIDNLSSEQLWQLQNFVQKNFAQIPQYMQLFQKTAGQGIWINNDEKTADCLYHIDINTLRHLIKEPLFEQQLKLTKQKDLRYLIQSIIILPYTSDQIYWQNDKFKKNYTKSMIHLIWSKNFVQYRIMLCCGLIIMAGYIMYKQFKVQPALRKLHLKALSSKPEAVDPRLLLAQCLANNDKYFKDLGGWTLVAVKCNSLSSVFTFSSTMDTTLTNFRELIGGANKNLKYANKIGIYTQNYKIKSLSPLKFTVTPEAIISNLQQAVINYGITVSLPQAKLNKKHHVVKFTIISEQSPIFLYNHNILNNVRLLQISMNLDKNSGLYNWLIQGEF
ncbi:MAG: hypothetical protein KBD37_03085 [Burkholderiales bacterium]|nr:hypothetical protein [Burkholderiales bacterium]